MERQGERVVDLVARLGLEPHPEGGWFRRTWVHPDPAGGSHPPDRAAGSAILFLVDAGATTSWHRVDAAEVWVHQSGGPVVLETWSEGDGVVRRTVLGPPTDAAASPQHVVDPGTWQRAVAGPDWTLVTCVVVPEFRFDRFEQAPAGWEPLAT